MWKSFGYSESQTIKIQFTDKIMTDDEYYDFTDSQEISQYK